MILKDFKKTIISDALFCYNEKALLPQETNEQVNIEFHDLNLTYDIIIHQYTGGIKIEFSNVKGILYYQPSSEFGEGEINNVDLSTFKASFTESDAFTTNFSIKGAEIDFANKTIEYEI